MQLKSTRTPKSQKLAIAGMLTAAVASLSMLPSPARADQREWSAIPSVAGLWSTPSNWTTAAPIAGDSLLFRTSTNYNPFNNLAPNTLITGINFDSGSNSYNISGNTINFNGDLTNLTAVNQTLSLNLNLAGSATNVNTGSGIITLGGSITGTRTSSKMTPAP